ncbi:hypothetical protein B9Z19DRAFT_1053764 [Tuber borchii]|uniref:DUF6536 domain-containing protein n=1 Tax=Tuber borchii TaxID=42251 RepID=A0A2T6ZJ80_TUBBO|nr:hypothetical protein B9Z19DRAFT_1053764 [Tuber borchii]
MRDFRKKLPEWTAIPLGDNSWDGGGGSKSSLIELLPLDSESTQERLKSLSSAWKPVWYTGWHTGVLACAASAVVVLFINLSLRIYAATDLWHKMEKGIGTLYSGNCDMSRTIGLWLHLGINALSTLLLSGSNYTQQCLSAPTRSEIDAWHAKRKWMDIGAPGVKNLFRIKPERRLLWIAIGFTSIPLHLLYNSAVYTSLAANGFFITFVTSNHFEKGGYKNTTIAQIDKFMGLLSNTTSEKNDREILPEIQLFSSMLEGYNTSTERYKDLTPLECLNAYSRNFVSSHRNLFLITKHSSNTTYNNTVLNMAVFSGAGALPGDWRSPYDLDPALVGGYYPSHLSANLTRGLPWQVNLTTTGVVEIAGCKSEIVDEKCKVQFSLGIMIVVICCNFVKACCMIMAVVRSREPTLVTLGDAIDSFLRVPDSTTKGVCFADRQYIAREWKLGRGTRPTKWEKTGVQRWRTSASYAGWATCFVFFFLYMFYILIFLINSIQTESIVWSMDLKSMWTRGLGKVNGVSVLSSLNLSNITRAVLISNIPQTILSFLYLTYNSLFTGMLLGHEWSLFSHYHRTLRVTSPRPGQRSTYWLQIPYTYAIPLMTLGGLLHWLTSQSIFLARVDISDPFGRNSLDSISTVGYSCIAIIFVLVLAILALLTAAGMGYKKLSAEITNAGSCSAAISAACHASGADSEEMVGKKVRWGDVGIVPDTGVRHLTFSSEIGVGKPVFGEVYAGIRRGESDCL